MNGLPFIDTNVFLRFLIIDRKNSSLCEKAGLIIRKIQEGTIRVQMHILTVAEIVYVLEHFYKINKEEIVNKLEPLLLLENLMIEKKGLIIESLRVYKEKNVDFEDAYTYVCMIAQNVSEIYTFDTTHFKRFPEVKIL